jgi:hypothetical protein
MEVAILKDRKCLEMVCGRAFSSGPFRTRRTTSA